MKEQRQQRQHESACLGPARRQLSESQRRRVRKVNSTIAGHRRNSIVLPVRQPACVPPAFRSLAQSPTARQWDHLPRHRRTHANEQSDAKPKEEHASRHQGELCDPDTRENKMQSAAEVSGEWPAPLLPLPVRWREGATNVVPGPYRHSTLWSIQSEKMLGSSRRVGVNQSRIGLSRMPRDGYILFAVGRTHGGPAREYACEERRAHAHVLLPSSRRRISSCSISRFLRCSADS